MKSSIWHAYKFRGSRIFSSPGIFFSAIAISRHVTWLSIYHLTTPVGLLLFI
jgi:hypothetical protein